MYINLTTFKNTLNQFYLDNANSQKLQEQLIKLVKSCPGKYRKILTDKLYKSDATKITLDYFKELLNEKKYSSSIINILFNG